MTGWQTKLRKLKIWMAQHHGKLPRQGVKGKVKAKLPLWVNNMRKQYKHISFGAMQIKALEAMQAWSWSAHDCGWNDWYGEFIRWFYGKNDPQLPAAVYTARQMDQQSTHSLPSQETRRFSHT